MVPGLNKSLIFSFGMNREETKDTNESADLQVKLPVLRGKKTPLIEFVEVKEVSVM